MFILIIFLVLVIVYIILSVIYKQYVIKHSTAYKNIKILNEKYQFGNVKLLKFYEKFDNRIYYEKLKPKDLLFYNLIKNMKIVKENIASTINNFNNYALYLDDIKNNIEYGKFDIINKYMINYFLIKYEKKLVNNLIKHPITNFTIKVIIELTNINGKTKSLKQDTFDTEEIEEIILKLQNKTNGRYNDREIWDSICNIERAKVTNRMRFAIYKRDGYRCCKCGRKTNDLEIDHIMPIAKGGKTHPNNLQTLCKKCNMEKSDTIEAGTILYNNHDQKFCPNCGAPLKFIYSKNGKFYGCMNYPKCKYTEKI